MKFNFLKSLKKTLTSRRFLAMAAVSAICIVPTFASGTSGNSITELDTWASKILELFQSTWVKAILLIALIVEAIGLVLAGQQGGGGQIIKKFAPWIVGTIILLSASSICSYFLGDLNFDVAVLPQVQQGIKAVSGTVSCAVPV